MKVTHDRYSGKAILNRRLPLPNQVVQERHPEDIDALPCHIPLYELIKKEQQRPEGTRLRANNHICWNA